MAPPTPSVAAQACSGGGGKLSDPELGSLFPRKSGGYCLDPRGETRVYGENSKKPLNAICTEAFNGECEIYKSFGLKRVALFRYIDGGGTPGSVDTIVSKYATPTGAYAMFTKRVISDGDPAREGAPKPMKVSGAGAQGTGNVILWKSQLFVELTYTNETETPQQLEASSAKLLPALASEIAKRLPGPDTLPASAARLPVENLVPGGILFEPKDPLGISGAGAGAFGYYKLGDKRFRLLSILRNDQDQAKDVLGSVSKYKGAAKEKGVGEGAYHIMVGEEAEVRAEWIVARKGNQILGIGDESAVLEEGMTKAAREKLCMSREEKSKQLQEILGKLK